MLYKFNNYTFDPVLGVLSDEQNSIQLRPKLAQLLEYFLANSGRVITRDELLSELWVNGEYRESSLTQSIRELRKQLNDSVHNPDFIKTYPQRGYIWIADVVLPVDEVVMPDSSKNGTVRVFNTRYTLPLIGTLVLFFSFWFWESSHSSSQENQTQQIHTVSAHRLLIAPFENLTGETELDWLNYGLRHMVIQGLKDSPEYTVVADKKALQLLAIQSAEGAEVHTSLNSIIDEGHADQWLSASVSQEFGRFVFRYHLSQPNSVPKEGVIYSEGLDFPIDNLAKAFVEQVTGGFNKVSTFKVSENHFSTKDYLEGLYALETHGVGLAMRYFEASSLHDPNNSYALVELARAYWHTGQVEKSQKIFAKLYDNAELLTDTALRARMLIYWGELQMILGDYAEAERLLQQALAIAEKLNNDVIRSRVFSLMSSVSWRQQKWHRYEEYRELAKIGLDIHTEIESEAARLYYIGSPPSARPDQDPMMDLKDSLVSLQRSLKYYEDNHNLSLLMKTYFAIGQNYMADIDKRREALIRALELAIEQEEVLYKVKIANYLGFFYIQLHDGQKAKQYLNIAAQVIEGKLVESPLKYRNQLLIAMANMDAGIALSDPSLLELADKGFATLQRISNSNFLHIKADAYLLHGWTFLAQQRYQEALPKFNRALNKYRSLELDDSVAYAQYSLMYAHLQLGEHHKAIELLANGKDKKLKLDYAAFAYMALEQKEQAQRLLSQSKVKFASNWRPQDEQLLQSLLKNNPQQTPSVIDSWMAQIQKPYSVYCESEWNL